MTANEAATNAWLKNSLKMLASGTATIVPINRRAKMPSKGIACLPHGLPKEKLQMPYNRKATMEQFHVCQYNSHN